MLYLIKFICKNFINIDKYLYPNLNIITFYSSKILYNL